MVNTTKKQRLLNEEVNGIWTEDSTSQAMGPRYGDRKRFKTRPDERHS